MQHKKGGNAVGFPEDRSPALPVFEGEVTMFCCFPWRSTKHKAQEDTDTL